MSFVYLRLLVPMLLLVQLCTGVNRYCRKAVNSVEIVKSCPSSKAEWDDAARMKDCDRLASKQNCTTAEKFRYHCVINGYRNVTLEVCAPSRIIFGHCVEFNVPGGVIQDQRSAPCKEPFPRCPNMYNSWEAYKYPDCYMLVTMSTRPEYMTTNFPTTTSSKTNTEESFSAGTLIGIITAVVLVFLLVIFVAVVLLCKRKRRGTNNKTENTSSVPLEANSGQVHRDDVERASQEDEYEALISSNELDEVFQLDETQAEQSHTSENTCNHHTADQTDTQEDRINLLPNIHMHHMKPHPPKRRGSLNSASLAIHQIKIMATGRKRTFSAGF
ncbi:uncharacterized protein [Magallana gigas]|uniref:uncharacterized protein n=1 Tax=Magallana gigas TaxID=29159 RepID=UPI00333FE432